MAAAGEEISPIRVRVQLLSGVMPAARRKFRERLINALRPQFAAPPATPKYRHMHATRFGAIRC
ncbi:MAG: hypothetical protein ACKVS9_01045 [Phycisphaerae bacterium]